MSDLLRLQYLDALGFKDDKAREKALNRAYELREFEIEHYWKRGTYFWAFQIAIFAAFAVLWKNSQKDHQWDIVAVALSSLGALTAVATTFLLLALNSGRRIGRATLTCLRTSSRGNSIKRSGCLKVRRGILLQGLTRSSVVFLFSSGFWSRVTCLINLLVRRR